MMARPRFLLPFLIPIVPILAVTLLLLGLTPAGADPRLDGGINLTLTDRLGGAVMAVALQGSEAFVGLDEAVLAVDMTTVTAPLRRGQFALTDTVTTVAVSGDFVLASAGGHHLQVINFGDREAPADAGTWQAAGPVGHVTVAGQVAYLALGAAGLQLLDLADPLQPQPLGTYPAGIATQRVRVVGSRAYLTDVSGSLTILDVSDPLNPALLGSYGLGGPAADVRVLGNTAFVSWSECVGVNNCNAMYSALGLAQVMTPTHIRTRLLGPGAAGAIAVAGGYAYVSRYGLAGPYTAPVLTVLDVSVPQFSNIVATYNAPGTFGATDLQVGGVHAYLANGVAGLQLLSISDPLNPTWVSNVGGLPPPAALAWHNGRLLAFTGDGAAEGTLLALSPAGSRLNPTGAGAVPAMATAVDLALAGNIAVALGAASDGDGVLVTVDVSNPARPNALGGLFMDAPLHVAAAGNVAIVHDASGLRLFDLTVPATPVQVGTYTPAGDVALVGATAFVGAGNPGLQLLDVSNPAAPTLLGAYNPTWSVGAVAADGAIAVVGRSSGGIAVIDVSNPAVPVLLAEMPATWVPTQLVLMPDYVLAGVGATDVRVIHLADPTQPVPVGYYASQGGLSSVAAGAGQIYLADAAGVGMLTQQFRLGGRVGLANGLPWSDVDIHVNGAAAGMSGFDGGYAVDGNAAGTHMVSATQALYVFWPEVHVVDLPPGVLSLDFTVLAAPVTGTVSASGGQLSRLDPQGLAAELTVPAGAVLTDTTLSLASLLLPDEGGYGFAAHGFRLEARQNGVLIPDFTFAAPVTFSVTYSDPDIAGLVEEALLFWWGEPGAWSDASTGCAPPTAYARDLAGNVLALPLCVTGQMGLFGPQRNLYLPVVRQAP